MSTKGDTFAAKGYQPKSIQYVRRIKLPKIKENIK